MAVAYAVIFLGLLEVVLNAADFAPCGGKPADVFIALDSSGSIYEADFKKELRFAEDLTSMFDLDDDKVRVGILSFSKTVTPQFGLGDYSSRVDMFRKISEIPYEGYGTNTGEALNYIHSKGLSSKNTRPGIPHIAIVLTDGMSQNSPVTLEEAKLVHGSGITVFVIGIGSQVDKMELEAIASRPSNKYVFMIDNFDALNQIKDELAIKACEVQPATPSPGIQNTEAQVEEELMSLGRCTPRHSLDLVFAVDTAAIGASNTKFVLQFIGNISERINMGVSDSTIQVIGNGCSGSSLDNKPAPDPDTLKHEMSSYETPQFNHLMRNMRLKAVDGRMKASHIGIMFATDHLSSNDYRETRLQMMRAKFQGTAIFAIGVGKRVDENQYSTLTVNKGQYFHVDSFENLADVASILLYKLCLFATDK